MIAAPIVLSLVMTAGGQAPGGAQAPRLDRAQLVDALERLARTGEPRHVTHDEGQELDEALKAALAAGADAELQWLATRAAVPIVPAIRRPLSSRTRPGALHVQADRVLTLPWPVQYIADVDGRLDSGPWQRILRITSGVSEDRSLDKLLPAAAAQTPGFHTLRLRARIRYGQLPDGMPRRETRNLLTVHYGVWGSGRNARDPVRPFFDAAGSVSAAALDPSLPDVPFSSWLNQLPREEDAPPLMYWITQWCGLHESMSEEGLLLTDVCVVAHRGGPQRTTEVETWIKVGSLGSEENDEPEWVRKPPALVAAYVRDGFVRTRVPLSAAPGYLTQAAGKWPTARLVANAAGISVDSPTIIPGVPTTLRVLVANMGGADANGVMISVVASSEPDLLTTQRRFVRTIRAGGSVEIEMPVILHGSYGVVDVLLAPGPGHDPFGPNIDASRENQGAMTLINQRAAPAPYVQRVRRRCMENGRPAELCPR